jgi:hypothetical protein
MDPVYFNQYNEYAKVLRNWFVVYGVSATGVLVLEEAFKVIPYSNRRLIILLLLLGVGVQILATLFNKWSNWYLCFKKSIKTLRQSAVFINLLGDIFSLGLLIIATWLIIYHMSSASNRTGGG